MKRADKVWNAVRDGTTISYGPDGEVHIDGIMQMAIKACGFESGEIRFFVTGLVEAAKKRDVNFINGALFVRYCDLLRLDSGKIRNIFTTVWSNLDDPITK